MKKSTEIMQKTYKKINDAEKLAEFYGSMLGHIEGIVKSNILNDRDKLKDVEEILKWIK